MQLTKPKKLLSQTTHHGQKSQQPYKGKQPMSLPFLLMNYNSPVKAMAHLFSISFYKITTASFDNSTKLGLSYF